MDTGRIDIYYEESECEVESARDLKEEEMETMKEVILNSKEIRLRHGMIEDFEVIETLEGKDRSSFKYQCKLQNRLIYSYYTIIKKHSYIYIHDEYYEDPELKIESGIFTEVLYKEMADIILNQKNMRLRHLFNQYDYGNY